MQVNRGVDELYDMCEEEEDEQRCKDAIDIMVPWKNLSLYISAAVIKSTSHRKEVAEIFEN